MPEYNPRTEDNSASNCIPGFQTEMATKRQNLRTAALTRDVSFVIDISVLLDVSKIKYQGRLPVSAVKRELVKH